MPAELSRTPNRLVDATSPYLLQHAYNPVDWYPWGEEALQRARAEDKPVFLSIGYSACHWCHVMAHESFEDLETAALLNEHFVCIKVDREERPDLDEIYMSAVQIMTRSGGWPMSVFLTPSLKPFYCGTYFPPRDVPGRPGFKTLLHFLVQAWTERRDEVVSTANQLTDYVQRAADQRLSAASPISSQILDVAFEGVAEAFDLHNGGLQGAPKFPSAPMVSLLLRHHRRTGFAQAAGMAAFTLEKMAHGGIRDHLGGGFHRYSVDEHWLVPHFEKMLYDNAQLAQAYLEGYQVTGASLFREVAEETFAYILRELTSPEGAFYSSEDADSEGREGEFYVWTREEVLDALGAEDGRVFAGCYGVLAEGNFPSHEAYHRGKNILHLPASLEDCARELSMELSALAQLLERTRHALFERRAQRVRPGLDDKILTSWNALAISALARGAQVLGRSDHAVAAARAADFILKCMRHDGVLMRVYRKGALAQPGFLDDYAFLLVALIDLYETDFNARWRVAAVEVAEGMCERFLDRAEGGFYSAAVSQDDLFVRVKPVYDGAEPSGNTMAAQGLLRLGRLLDNAEYTEQAARILFRCEENLRTSPLGFLKLACVADFYLESPREVVVAGALDDPRTLRLLGVLRAPYAPNTVVAHAAPGEDYADIPLLRGRAPVDGSPAVYVCEHYACRRPVTTPEELEQL